MTLKEKTDLLTKDFLERDENDRFVRIRRSGRLGWESTLPQDSPYSAYILRPQSDVELIKTAYALAVDTIKVMNTPYRVKVKITNSTSATDSKTLWVATEMFDNTNLSTGQKLDTFIGLTVHEGCHLLYTDFNALQTVKDRLIHTLQNIIEDERIERLCGEEKPGLANFLKASKYYYFDLYAQVMQQMDNTRKRDTFTRLVNCIISYVRYPKALEQGDLEEFADTMLEVKEVLLPFPESTEGSIQTAHKIYDIIKRYLKQYNKNKKQDQKDQQNAQNDKQPADNNKDTGKDSEEKDTQQSKGSSGKDSSPQGDEKDGKDSSPNDDNSRKDTDSRGKNDGQKETDAQEDSQMTDEEVQMQIDKKMKNLQAALDNIARDPAKDSLSDVEQSRTVQEDNGNTGLYCQGDLEKGSILHTYLKKAQKNPFCYDLSLIKVKQYIPAISRALLYSSTELSLSLKGMRSGVLDTGKLAEAFQGVPTVYMREAEVKTQKVAVCILIDESGSMRGIKQTAARDTAVLLNEALNALPNVELYIYGHTGVANNTNIHIYREGTYRVKYTLGSTCATGGNHDSVAIRETTARIRTQTQRKCLMFIVNDNAPNESPSEVKKAVKEVSRQGFDIVAISIDPHFDPSTMYDNHLRFTDMSTLAIDLGKTIKKAILRNTKKTIKLT